MNWFQKKDYFNKKKLGLFFLYVIVVLLPFVVFYWMLPFAGNTTIGNDYVNFSPPQQLELQYSIERGTWPLFSPGFAGGRPSAALTLGQLFHPFSHIAAAIPGYFDGYALNITTILRLLSLGLAQLVILVLLRRLRLRLDLSFVISFITVYNLRMLDTFRFGASLESYTGLIFLFASLAMFFLKPTRVLGPVTVVVSTFLLVVGGHPQMMYFGMLAAGLTVLLIPFVLPAIMGEKSAEPKEALRFYGFSAAMIGVGVVLAAAYVLPLYFDFVSETAARAANEYKYSLLNSDSWGGELNNFFQPLNAAVTGVFGGTNVIGVILVIPVLAVLRARQPRVVYVVLGFFALILVIALGQATPVHFWFWKYFPLAGTFRVPGRITMMLPVLILLLLAVLWRENQQSLKVWGKDLRVPATTAVFLGALLLLALYEFWLRGLFPAPTHPVPEKFRKDFPDWMFSFVFWSGIATLTLAAAHGFRWRLRSLIGVLLILAVMAQTTVQLSYGTWVRTYGKTPTLKQMDLQKSKKLDFRGHPGARMQSDLIDRRMNQSFLESDIAKFYRKYIVADSRDHAFSIMRRERRADNIVVEGFAPASTMEQGAGVDNVELTYSSFNRLNFHVKNAAPGFLSLTFLGSERWSASADGRATTVYEANGGESAVYLSAGDHRVEYRFESPASEIGMVISLAVLALFGGFLSYRALKGRVRLVGIGLFVSSAATLFFLWESTLYGGDNLGTQYSWSSDQFSNPENLAFGKPTRMSSLQQHQRPFLHYAGRGVDGDHRLTGFRTRTGRKRPWWQVDLGKKVSIGEIIIFDGGGHGARAHLPMNVLLSKDGKKFKKAKSIETRGKERPWRIDMGGRNGRYVRLQSSSRKTPLSFKEIEVYSSNEK